MFEEILKHNLPKAGRVLEVGCGSGRLLRNLAQQYPEIEFWGVDPFVGEFQEGNLKLLPIRAEELVRLPGWFHLIFSRHSLHHFSSPQRFFKRAGEKLARGGRILIWDWDYGANTGIPERYFTKEELREMAQGAGLEVLTLENFGEENLLIAGAKGYKVAVASDDGKTVFPRMFGRATYFFIYKMDSGDYTLLERRRNIHRDNFQHLKTYDVYQQVRDCNTIITGKIGKKGEIRLKKLGVEIVKLQGKVEEVLDLLKRR